jgi:hypothetical protein
MGTTRRISREGETPRVGAPERVCGERTPCRRIETPRASRGCRESRERQSGCAPRNQPGHPQPHPHRADALGARTEPSRSAPRPDPSPARSGTTERLARTRTSQSPPGPPRPMQRPRASCDIRDQSGDHDGRAPESGGRAASRRAPSTGPLALLATTSKHAPVSSRRDYAPIALRRPTEIYMRNRFSGAPACSH